MTQSQPQATGRQHVLDLLELLLCAYELRQVHNGLYAVDASGNLIFQRGRISLHPASGLEYLEIWAEVVVHWRTSQAMVDDLIRHDVNCSGLFRPRYDALMADMTATLA